jgi:hypothetical protein
MTPSRESMPVSRRRALLLGGGLVAGAAATVSMPTSAMADVASDHRKPVEPKGHLPVAQMQRILQAEGTVTNHVLVIDLSREDIGDVIGPRGVTFTPAFEIDGALTFESLGDGTVFFNGDLALRPEETNPLIDAIIANGLTFQAFHQHYIDMSPNVWFIHWRGKGDALTLARAVKNVLDTTSMPFPQTPPSNPTTPLDPDRLAAILHGDAEVGDEGVVTVSVDRSDRIVIDGIHVLPDANISTQVEFKPMANRGSQAWAAPDFSMTSTEVMPVVTLMRRQGWFQGCLYNQETNEHPQLYFDHMLKAGNAYQLAHEIRRGLNLTASD